MISLLSATFLSSMPIFSGGVHLHSGKIFVPAIIESSFSVHQSFQAQNPPQFAQPNYSRTNVIHKHAYHHPLSLPVIPNATRNASYFPVSWCRPRSALTFVQLKYSEVYVIVSAQYHITTHVQMRPSVELSIEIFGAKLRPKPPATPITSTNVGFVLGSHLELEPPTDPSDPEDDPPQGREGRHGLRYLQECRRSRRGGYEEHHR